jgi:hypothetical protein
MASSGATSPGIRRPHLCRQDNRSEVLDSTARLCGAAAGAAVSGAHVGLRDQWFVPIVRGGEVGGVVVVPIYDNGMGSAGIATGWAGRFPHPLTPEQAAAKASTSSDAAVTVELVWATVDPRQGGPATEFLPFYVVTLRSGARWCVFNGGAVVEASTVDSVR